jgi:cation diffusion facilitator family transporter
MGGRRGRAKLQMNEKVKVAAGSVGVAVILTSGKLVIGLATSSLGILSEAAHSGLDLLAALMTWFAVSVSGKPADKDHPYGHQKTENLSALFETLLLVVTCVWILYEAVERLFFRAVSPRVNAWSFGVMIVSIILDYTRSRALYRVAKKTRSQALEADALHFSSDVASSLVVIAGLGLTWLGYRQADAIAAAGVAILVLVISFRLGWRAIEKLADKVPPGYVQRAELAAASVPGVVGVSKTRVREAGDKYFIDMTVAIRRAFGFSEAHALTEAVEDAVKKTFVNADVIVHAEPGNSPDEDVWERVRALADREGAVVHDLTLLKTPNGTEYDLHLEWPPETPFAKAHGAATRIEEELKLKEPGVFAVTIHLEPRAEPALSGREVTREHPALADDVIRAVNNEPEVVKCLSARLRETGGGLHVAVTCALGRGLTLPEAHAATGRMEAAIRALSPKIEQVTVHAEPAEE